ncbi:MAG: 2-phospho-L-lactate guanylyltransferase [Acidimicrobiia bacterium]
MPIKPFGVAKGRLASVLDAPARSRLGRAVANNTLAVLAETGVAVAVVTADGGVAKWASSQGVRVIVDPNTGLDDAAAAAVAASQGRWAILHADLPLISVADVRALLDAIPRHGVALAPSADGGTTAVAGTVDSFGFAYGPGSFARHLRAAAAVPHAVVSRPGLALDLDTPADYAMATSLLEDSWLTAAVAG